MELLEAGHHHQAAIPLSRARDLAPDKTSIREGLGLALFHVAALRAGGRRVSGDRRSRADERLRAVLPGPLPAAARPSRRGAATPDTGRVHAADTGRLPALPGPREGSHRGGLREARPAGHRCYARIYSFCNPGTTWRPYRKWALARFFCLMTPDPYVGATVNELQTEIEDRLATAAPEVEVLLVEVLQATYCASSSIIRMGSRSPSASGSPT